MFYVPPNGALMGSSVTVAVVPSGDVIGPDSSFTNTSATQGSILTPGAFRVGGTFMTGIRLRNEATGIVNYGWIGLTTTGPTGFPATINRYCYENTGAGMAAGTLPVALQSFSID